MNELLKIILSLSLSGALLILVLLLCKPLVKDKFSKRWQYYIWLIVVARLLLPFAPETNLMGMVFHHFDNAMIQTDTSPQQEQEPSALPETDFSDQHGVPGQVGLGDGKQLEPEQAATPSMFEMVKQNIAVICLLVWLIVAACLLIRKVTVYQSFVKYINAGRIEISDMQLWERVGKLVEQTGIKGAIGLYTNSLISSPLLIGFFRPCIMLPTTELSESDFENTILHELTHYKRRDMFYKWLVQVTICLHWFNPLVYIMGREVNRACELSCDEAVIQSMDVRRQRAYGDTLLNAMGMGGNYKDSLASVTLNEGKELLKERLDAIMRFKKTTRLTAVISMMLVLVLCFGATAAGAYTNTIQQPKDKLMTTENQGNNTNQNITTVPVDVEIVKNGTFIWLGEFTLSYGDKMYYDVSAENGNGLKTGFAAPDDDPLNRTHFTISNKRVDGTLETKGGFTFEADSPVEPGQYNLFIQATDGDLTNVKGSITIETNSTPTNIVINPSLTLNIRSAAVTMEVATDNKISAEYNSNVYNVEINNQGNDWKIDISSKTRTNTNTETIKLFIPNVNYSNINMNVDSAYLTSTIIKSGNIVGNFNTASVLLTLPKGFNGSLDATATSGYFELISKDDFSNTNATIIDDGEIGEVYVPKDFIKNGDTFTFADGTQNNVIKVTRKGTGVIGIYSSDYSDSVDSPSDWQSEWENSWQGDWWKSWNNSW